MTSIPASQLVNVTPGVLGTAGDSIDLNAVFLTQDTSVPIDTVKSFTTLADVQSWFGATSTEATLAAIYFQGYSNATILPGLLYFMQYNVADVGAYLRGGSLSGMTLAQLQLLSGVLTTVIDGVSSTSANIDLSTATSFSNAATLIQTGIQGGTPVSTATVTYDSQRAAFVIHSPTTGATSTIDFATGTLSAGLKLTAATGAVTSQGADATTPADTYATLVTLTQNWATLMTVWEPSTDDKVLFAQANSSYGPRYMYVGWDTAVGPTAAVDPTSFGALTEELTGRAAVWGTADKAAFICGATASINFERTNGRITFAYKSLDDLEPDVTNATVAQNLLDNGYNFYGEYATATTQFQFLQNGQISGDWLWMDPYVNQIKLNADFQLALLTMLSQSNSVPYVTRGYDLIRSAMMDPINSALNFGTIVAGVTLSSSQRTQLNTAAGTDIADTVQSRGWYLLIQDASSPTRIDRESPPMTFWYTDGGSIQKLSLASINAQ